ncbi:hypothetical protein B1R32_11423 [Abditibacterium utsteinense]|uniref:Uncharacterized protein n=1 Tax=Abditibacterium utsteinense TaxID=1960156 RepID=A0A2S8SQZ0_9BACT|nr:hypothetical protein B1R32_11423 [Abditibacterium utsteinense]
MKKAKFASFIFCGIRFYSQNFQVGYYGGRVNSRPLFLYQPVLRIFQCEAIFTKNEGRYSNLGAKSTKNESDFTL